MCVCVCVCVCVINGYFGFKDFLYYNKDISGCGNINIDYMRNYFGYGKVDSDIFSTFLVNF